MNSVSTVRNLGAKTPFIPEAATTDVMLLEDNSSQLLLESGDSILL